MDPEQSLLKETGGQPGVDHLAHSQGMRQDVAQNAGVEIADVTPSEEVAKNIIDSGTSQFLETVAHTTSEQVSASADSKSSDIFGDFEEAVRAYAPGGETDRTASSKGLAELENERQEKMTKVS